MQADHATPKCAQLKLASNKANLPQRIETSNSGAIVLSIFSKTSTKTSPKRFLFCEEKTVQAGRRPPRFYCARQYCSTLFPLQVVEFVVD